MPSSSRWRSRLARTLAIARSPASSCRSYSPSRALRAERREEGSLFCVCVMDVACYVSE